MTIPLPTVAELAAEEYPPLSALNDLLFCARRCFLHRVEGVWVENRYTGEGTRSHKKVHATKDTEADGVREARGLRLVSHRLRVVGVADLVEFRPGAGGGAAVPFPVEYKRGKRRKWDNDDVQLCAQAMCLEEMRGVAVPAGAVFHVSSKRRREVAFTAALRAQTEQAARRLHEVLAATVSPPAVLHPKCKRCSLHAVCMPELFAVERRYAAAGRSLFRVSDSPT